MLLIKFAFIKNCGAINTVISMIIYLLSSIFEKFVVEFDQNNIFTRISVQHFHDKYTLQTI